MLDGLLSPNDIRGPLESNICDIRALAISELALAKVIGWDISGGKTSLFLLAKHNIEIAGGGLFIRLRRRIAGWLRKLAEWVGANGTR